MLRSYSLVFSRLIVSFLFLLVLYSCGDSALLDLYSGGEDILFQSFAPGSTLEPGESVPVTVSAADGSDLPSFLDLKLFSAKGELLKNWTMNSMPSISALDTESLDSGFYTMTVEAGGGTGGMALPLTVPFFVSPGSSVIQTLSAYPPAAKPGEGMLFFADVALSGYDYPYLRWSAGGRVISSGLVEAGASLISWQVPEIEGVYPVLAELFPYAPDKGSEFDFTAVERFRIEAFVSSDPGPVRGELAPDESYSVLFHFRGSIESDGFVESPDISMINSPELAVEEGVFGYRFSSSDGLRAEGLGRHVLFPVSNGLAGPCTIELKGLFSDPGKVFALISGSGDNEKTAASGVLTDDGFFLQLGDQQVLFPFSADLMSVPRSLALSLLPQKGSTAAYFYIDGILRNSLSVYTSPLPADVDKLEIGTGFSGVLDEFGIYSLRSDGSPGIDASLYSAAMKDKYGKMLLLAEGFDGGIPDALLLQGSQGISSSESPGALKIAENGRVGFSVPVSSAPEGSLELHVSVEPGRGEFEIRSESSEVLLSGILSGEYVQMDWKVLSDAVMVYGPGGREIEIPYSDSPGNIQVWLACGAGALQIKELLLLKAELQIGANIPESGKPGV